MLKTAFTALVDATKDSSRFAVYDVEPDASVGTSVDFISFAQPTDVLVSRWYPGYRVIDLSGTNAEETIAIMLANSLDSVDALEQFRRLLASPGIATAVMGAMIQRAGQPLAGRKYYLAEDYVRGEVSKAVKASFPSVDAEVIQAYAYAVIRVLASKDLILPSSTLKVVAQAESFVVRAEDIKRVILVEAMRGIFSETRIQAATKRLDQDATIQVYSEVMAEMFRSFSFSIPEVKHRLEQLDTATRTVLMFHLGQDTMPQALLAHPSLLALSRWANFAVFAAQEAGVTMPAFSVPEIKEACDNTLTVIQSAPSIELMSLSKYAEMFGEVPISSGDGLKRGIVLYRSYGQTSKMEVADVAELPSGEIRMALLEPIYAKGSMLAPAITGSLLSRDSLTGLANVVADEFATAAAPLPIQDVKPMLATIQVDKTELLYLALARAESVAFVEMTNPQDPSKPMTLLFSCIVQEQWRSDVMAATPTTAFFYDPAAVLLYMSDMRAKEPTSLPSRPQSIGLKAMQDQRFTPRVVNLLSQKIEEPFRLKLTTAAYGTQEPIVLTMLLSMLNHVVKPDGTAYDRGGAFYASVREPGVETEIETLMKLARPYVEGEGGEANRNKACSWLIVKLVPILSHPTVRRMAERAVAEAMANAGLDGRRLAPQMREVYNRAFFGAALTILNRYGYIDNDMVAALVKAIPSQSLSLDAILAMAAMPNMVDTTARRGSSVLFGNT